MATQIEENKRIAVGVYTGLFNKKDLSIIEERIAPNYRQYNPTVHDGAEELRSALEGMLASFPELRVDVKGTTAEVDLVALHVHWSMNPEDRGSAIVDVFRLENGLLVEHWDVIQEIAETSANHNGMS
ncbi:MAG: hypothetical protein A2V52_06035 [Actinobacteria bacterium RBG_19FT_COMBO_54_7]|uniref:SnoaL-like domain-containing protein n=1 Tax=Candidatus Solincola sediminis TaxID=1797199 RepID=A0A1F2WTG9_9ACTN|nr:MAG: hypothetical protein A2Y75_02165 [Candidatus Solincola sediminis]OFW60828.1 MAG: hypothetical protein A2W01_11570 [Candidatus Solincola sediminis]OFW69027.1 MAG: hypothetical protein A2V52_06035 [Actinobacteria bacterium RBG_19FT_COMBO_54_7]